MNNVTLSGRLTKDVELRKTQDGKVLTNFTLAVPKKYKNSGADFINCSAWGKTAENMEKYLHKGSQIMIRGNINTNSYEKNGVMQYSTQVTCEEVEFLGSKADNENPQTHVENTYGDYSTVGSDIKDEDLPW